MVAFTVPSVMAAAASLMADQFLPTFTKKIGTPVSWHTGMSRSSAMEIFSRMVSS